MTLQPLFPDYPPISVDSTATNLAWHLRLAQELPMSFFENLCGAGLFNRTQLALVVFGSKTVPNSPHLALEHANTAYRVLFALEAARAAFKGDVAKAVAWLSSAQATLKGLVPLSMLNTSMGFDYVRTAISRLS